MKAFWKQHWLHVSLLSVGVLILVALIFNLAQGGVWIVTGRSGKSAYELAVEGGFQGSLQEWLLSIAGSNGEDGSDGQNGTNGKSAYELAVENGFQGSLQEWLLSLSFGKDGKDGKDGLDGENGKNGSNGQDGKDGVSIRSAFINDEGHLIIILSDGSRQDAGPVGSAQQTPTAEKSNFQKAQEAGYGGTLHEWLCSYQLGSDSQSTVQDVTRSDAGHLLLTLGNGTVLDAGEVPQDGYLSDAMDVNGFRPRFEMVVMNREAYQLNLRARPNDTSSPAVTYVTAGDELICIGAAEIDGDLFYQFSHKGTLCYAKAKYFDVKYDYLTEFPGLNLPDSLVLTAGVPFRFVTEEIMPWADTSYLLLYTYSEQEASLFTEEAAGVTLTAAFRDGSTAAPHAAEQETLTVTLCKNTGEGLLLLHMQAVTVTVCAPAEPLTLTGLFVGDSRIASGSLLSSLCEQQPTLSLLGTLQNGAGIACEGRGGWKAENLWKSQSVNGTGNAFYNPDTKCFDFSYYMAQNYPGTELDFVALNLGANDLYTRASVGYLSNIVESIHAFNPSITVLIMTEYVSPGQDVPYYADLTRRAQFRYFSLLEQAFANREAENIWLLPNYLSIDTWGDRILRDNGAGGQEIADFVHLGAVGYQREASIIQDYLSLIFSE